MVSKEAACASSYLSLSAEQIFVFLDTICTVSAVHWTIEAAFEVIQIDRFSFEYQKSDYVRQCRSNSIAHPF